MKMTLRRKLILWIGAPTALIYTAFFILTLVFLRQQSVNEAHDDLQAKAAAYAGRFDDFLANAQTVAGTTIGALEIVPGLDTTEHYALLRHNLENNDEIYGSAIGFAPHAYRQEFDLYAPYVYRSEGEFVEKNITRDVADYVDDPRWEWYRLPMEAGEGVWTSPYFDEGVGNALMTTYGVPFRKEGEPVGVVTVDIRLNNLREVLRKSGVDPGNFVIVSREGNYIYHPDVSRILHSCRCLGGGENCCERTSPAGEEEKGMWDAFDVMLKGGSGTLTIPQWSDGKPHVVSYAEIPSTGWVFATARRESEVMAPYRQRALIATVVFVVELALILGTILYFSGKIARPITRLQGSVSRIAEGDLDARVEEVRSHDEIGELSRSFNRMTAKLKDNVQNLAKKEAERLEAEEANRVKSDFLSHMSHELRTPLNGILGYAQILQRDHSIDAKQHRSLDAIVGCGDHLLSLINDVLDLSKIEAGRQEVENAALDLHALVKGVADIVRPRAEAKSLALTVEVSPEVPMGIVSDGPKIRQILVNLLGNAVKFTKEGEVVLRLAEKQKGKLNFEIEDTGMGIPEEQLEVIFDPFKQVEGGKAEGGTGLGLAICRQLTEMLGGKVSVQSEVGKGTVFFLEVPLVEAHEDAFLTALPGGADTAHTESLAPGQDFTLLVADDREANRDVLTLMLEGVGFKVVTAVDGVEALEKLKVGDIDLALLDVRMPRMNGIEVVQGMREDGGLREIPALAVTASVFPEFRDKAKAAGFDDFLGKPFRVAALMEKLDKHLGLRWVSTAGGVRSTVSDAGESEEGCQGICVPVALRESLAKAVRIRSLTTIKQIARDLEADAATAPVAQRILELAGKFDFPGLQAFVDTLEIS